MEIIWHWLILSLALFFTGYLLPAQIGFTPVYVILVVAAVLEFVNFTIKPVINLLTLPINILTLGLFSVVINGLIFYGLTFVIHGFHVRDISAAIIGALVVSILNWVLEKIL